MTVDEAVDQVLRECPAYDRGRVRESVAWWWAQHGVEPSEVAEIFLHFARFDNPALVQCYVAGGPRMVYPQERRAGHETQ